MVEKRKNIYEKPVSLDAGSVASVLGYECSSGSTADSCPVTGNNPNFGPMCTYGFVASYNCGNGETNETLCGAGSTANDGSCKDGSTANGDCAVGSTGDIP